MFSLASLSDSRNYHVSLPLFPSPCAGADGVWRWMSVNISETDTAGVNGSPSLIPWTVNEDQ